VSLIFAGFCVGVVCHLGWTTVRDATTARVVEPVITAQVVRDYAASNNVCVRPLLRQATDRETGGVERLVIPCGSTREAVCPACAEKARRLRMQQCAEGWHLDEDPLEASEDDDGADGMVDDADAESEPVAESQSRRVRSTRRRSDVEELPRTPAENRSVGRTFTAPDETTYRPSMFVTLTLGSYGRVVSAKPDTHVLGAGSPVSPERYDYRGEPRSRRCSFFSRLFDRWMQNLRRCAGFLVQYFGAIEPQRRLAPHIHLADPRCDPARGAPGGDARDLPAAVVAPVQRTRLRRRAAVVGP
jgi:hypothetical protein